ncbi:ABC transporter substrate-binding protein [Streptomyces sp. NPDC056500]|uniref:ABC transporter substrate-binding protein n=1 Tax=Streptomyces sp. NPDC056500 TaxID=3345840 RepID=UPI0036B77F66
MQPLSCTPHTPNRGDRSHRRFSALIAATLALALALTACGDSDGDEPTDSRKAGAAGSYPVSITHAKGKTVVPSKPKRVVALGYVDVALARALGAPIVGALKFSGGSDGRNFPAVTPPLDEEVAVLDEIKPNVEKIAALRPDLILMTSGQPTYQDAYSKLSAIAPTLGYRTKLAQDDPTETTRLMGELLGEQKAATELIASSERAIADFVAKHPAAKGKKALFGQALPDNAYLLVTPDAQVNRFFARLGLVVPAEFAALAGDVGPTGSAALSLEELDRLDAADIAFLLFRDAKIKDHALVRALDLTKTGRLASLDMGTAYVVLLPNPANTAYLLSKIEPTVAKLAE